MSDDEIDYLWGKRHALVQRIEISALYHQKRERFFDLLDKSAKALAVIGGSAALARLGGSDWLNWIAGAITVTSTLSLVGGFSDKARRHSELSSKFRQLEAEVSAQGERDFSESDINAWSARRGQLESTEPPTLGLLVAVCQNELAVAQGHPESVVPVPAWRRWLAHYFDQSNVLHRKPKPPDQLAVDSR